MVKADSPTRRPGPDGSRGDAEEATGVGEQESPAAMTPSPSGRAKSSPVARRLAQEAGVDVGSVAGSGPGGRVVKRDVEEAVARGGTGPLTQFPGEPDVEYEDFQLNQMRKTIARRLTESLGPVPHFFLTIDVDMERALEARGEINRVLEPQGEKVSINDLLIRATAAALKRHPACNAAWLGDWRDPAGGTTWPFPAAQPHAYNPTFVSGGRINALPSAPG